jgi:NAD(P)-dependent dehydrogenase (short-subunit alcohol dehydrogenase family)
LIINDSDLSSKKIALVTGGARRLGKEIAVSLGETGFEIIINYHASDKSDVEEAIRDIQSTGANVMAVKCDISKVSEIKKMFHSVYLKYKKLDLLVNNAAVFKHTDFLETSEKTYDMVLNTNLKSVFFCSQEAARIMLKSNEPVNRIINISSLGSIENWTGYIPYSIAKAGVTKLTKQLAKKLAPSILVNAIAPERF